MFRIPRIAAQCCAMVLLFYGPIDRADAQFIPSGGEYPTTQRMQIPAGPLRIIYPEGHDSIAMQVARYAAKYRAHEQLHLESNRRFPIILRSFTPISNGLVAWVPSRMELYSTTGGEQDYPVPWLDHLVSHEMRHYAQLNALHDGPFKYLYYLVGEQSYALASFFTPLWFFEGDAIAAESRSSRYGRSQSALTYQQFRTDLLTGNRLSYDQYLNRSLRYGTPNHYAFGTLMVEYAISQYGDDFWQRVIQHSRWHSFLFFPFHFGIKSITGKTRHQLFENAIRMMDSTYRSAVLFPEEIKAEAREDWRDERYPHILPRNAEIVRWEKSFNHRMACYAVKENGIKRSIVAPSNLYGRVRYTDSIALWSEIASHPLWSHTQQANIRAINLNNGQTVGSTRQGSYMSPILLPGSQLVAAIRVNSYGAYDLVRLPLALDANPIDSMQIRNGMELREICTTPFPNCVALRAVNRNGMHLLLVNTQIKQVDTLSSNLMVDASGLSSDQQGVYFSCTYQYARRGFLVPWSNITHRQKRVSLLRIPSHGVEDIAPMHNNRLAYSSYTVNGYRVKLIDTAQLIPVDTIHPNANPFSRNLNDFPSRGNYDSIGQAFRYGKFRHAVRIHSWTPSYSLPALDLKYITAADIGITLLSQNDLGTLSMYSSIFYKETYGASFTSHYTGIWPHITLQAAWGGLYRLGDTGYGWKKLSSRIDGSLLIQFPAHWIIRDTPFSIAPGINFKANNDPPFYQITKSSEGGNLQGVAQVQLSWQTLSAPRRLSPKWGIVLKLATGSTIIPAKRFAPWYHIGGVVYLPGIAENDSFQLSAHTVSQWRRQDLVMQRFSKIGEHPSLPLYYKMGTAQHSVSAEYLLPIAYPDLNLGSWIYIKRLHGSIGGQYSMIKHIDSKRTQTRTVFATLRSDIHPFRTHYECAVGIRGTIAPFKDRLGDMPNDFWHIEALFNVSIPPKGN